MPRDKHPTERLVFDPILMSRLPEVRGDFRTDGEPDPQKIATAMKAGDAKINTAFNRNKRLAMLAYHSAFGSHGEPDEKYTLSDLARYFADHCSYYVETKDLRKMVQIGHATYFFGDPYRDWMDSFFPSTQHEIALTIFQSFKRNPATMTDEEIVVALPKMDAIMKAVPKGTPLAKVRHNLQRAGVLLTPEVRIEDKRDGEVPEGGLTQEQRDEIIIERIRQSKDGMIAGMFMPRERRGQPAVEARRKAILEWAQRLDPSKDLTRDQALDLLEEAGAKAMGWKDE